MNKRKLSSCCVLRVYRCAIAEMERYTSEVCHNLKDKHGLKFCHTLQNLSPLEKLVKGKNKQYLLSVRNNFNTAILDPASCMISPNCSVNLHKIPYQKCFGI